MSTEQFAAEYERGRVRVMRLLNKKRCREEEDVSQEAWLRAWRARDTFEGRNGATFGSWVSMIAVNEYRGTLRRVTPEQLPDDVNRFPMRVNLGAALDVEVLLARARPMDRDILLDYFILGMSTAELAVKYGGTRLAMRMKIYWALRRVREGVAHGGTTGAGESRGTCSAARGTAAGGGA